jgi:hypothetical protein
MPRRVRQDGRLSWSRHQPDPTKEFQMPIIAWLLGVPITVIILLMLFGVF